MAQDRSRVQVASIVFGVVFLVVGLAGFIPGLTTDYDRLGTFGGVAAKLLGIFGVNWLENVTHLLYGAAGLAAASTAARSRQYFLFGGVLYAIVGIYGVATGVHSDANILGVNEAGNVLHFVLAVVMIGVALVLGREEAATA